MLEAYLKFGTRSAPTNSRAYPAHNIRLKMFRQALGQKEMMNEETGNS
jgi:hypothetical protein